MSQIDRAQLLEAFGPSHPKFQRAVFHGTFNRLLLQSTQRVWESIVATGMRSDFGAKAGQRDRAQFHFSLQVQQGGSTAGVRDGTDVLVSFDVERALRDGMKVWLVPATNVVLVDGFDHPSLHDVSWIPPAYLLTVTCRATGRVLWS